MYPPFFPSVVYRHNSVQKYLNFSIQSNPIPVDPAVPSQSACWQKRLRHDDVLYIERKAHHEKPLEWFYTSLKSKNNRDKMQRSFAARGKTHYMLSESPHRAKRHKEIVFSAKKRYFSTPFTMDGSPCSACCGSINIFMFTSQQTAQTNRTAAPGRSIARAGRVPGLRCNRHAAPAP